ncbi:MAG: substrate-binding domain-containing protein [Proteobacteria bacterium]|nr:substrate-binding domain-containing protein [Pseudomonadota bacterium]
MANTHTSFAQEVLRYNGSSTVLKGIMYRAAKEFNEKEGIKIDLKGKSTGFGIQKLLAGECDIAGGGRPLKAKEKEKGLVETKAFSDAFVIVVHPTNPLTEITSQQLTDILQGKIEEWDDLNGPKGKKIVIISPPVKSATYDHAKELLEFNELPQNTIFVDMTPTVYTKVKTFPVSIGWLSHATLMDKKDIKILQLIDNGNKSGMSQLRTMYFYTMGEPQGNSKKFIDFMKSSRGQAIITDAGFFIEN